MLYEWDYLRAEGFIALTNEYSKWLKEHKNVEIISFSYSAPGGEIKVWTAIITYIKQATIEETEGKVENLIKSLS